MSCAETTGDERIFLEVLAMADLGLAARTMHRNWDVDPQRANRIFNELCAKGLVEELGDGVYSPTTNAEEMVSNRAVADSHP